MTEIVIAFRAEPRCFHWAVVEGTQQTPVLVSDGNASAPTTFIESRALAWYRERVMHLIDQYRPAVSVVRYPEPVSRYKEKNTGRLRCRIEGVILEALAFRAIPVLTGPLATISAKLGSGAKKYLDQKDLRGLDWSTLERNRKEAVLAGVAALPKSR